MLENISKEIFYYSFIPVFLLAIIVIILLIIGRKKKDSYKYNYIVKVSLFLLISFILPLMIGYTIWVFERVINLDILSSNILYLIVLVIIDAGLLSSLIIMAIKLYQGYKEKELQ